MLSIAVLACLLQDSIPDLIERLGSDRVELREDATARLKSLGAAALPALAHHEDAPDPEVRARAGHLRRVIAVRAALGARILGRWPGIDERLASADWRGALESARQGAASLSSTGLRALFQQASEAARRRGESNEFCSLFASGLTGTTLAEERVRVRLDASVLCFGATIGDPAEVSWTRSLRLAVINDRVYREGDVVPELGARLARIGAHAIELRPLAP
jgi:hypothetical protein